MSYVIYISSLLYHEILSLQYAPSFDSLEVYGIDWTFLPAQLISLELFPLNI